MRSLAGRHRAGVNFKNFPGSSPYLKRETQKQITEAQIFAGIARRELFLAYQPQFSINGSNLSLTGVEALIRWNHPTLGLLSPGQFLTEVKTSELQAEIGAYVLDMAIDQIHTWLESDAWSPKVAINMAAPELECPRLCSNVLAALASSGVAPRYIEVEILESEKICNPERLASQLRALIDTGVTVAFDDFGTGFASLQYLLHFPCHTLKIPSCFVQGIGQGIGADEICRAVSELGHALGKRVVAEGVETLNQLAFLRTHNNVEVQGFLLANPMTGPSLTSAYLAKGKLLFETLDVGDSFFPKCCQRAREAAVPT